MSETQRRTPTRLRRLAGSIACALVVAAFCMEQGASAQSRLRINTHGGAACRPSSGYGADTLALHGYTAVNNGYGAPPGATAQYIVCGVPKLRDPDVADAMDGSKGFHVALLALNQLSYGVDPLTVQCAAVVGTGSSATVVVRSVDVLPLGSGWITFGTTELPIRSAQDHLAINCLLPLDTAIEQLSVWQPKNY